MQAAMLLHLVHKTIDSNNTNNLMFVQTDIKLKHEQNLKYHATSAVLLAQEYAIKLMQAATNIPVRDIYLTARQKFIAVKFVLENERDAVEFLALAHRLMPRPFREKSVIVSTPTGYIVRLKH